LFRDVNFPGDKPERTKCNGNPGGAIHKFDCACLLAGAAVRYWIRGRHRIISAATPRLTAQQPFHS
jgi:hypothetical protein